MKTLLGLLVFALTLFACTNQEYHWAFAQDMDGSIKKNEYCRESLAQTIYDSRTSSQGTRESITNVFIFRGNIESYRVYAFKTQAECETALTGLVSRQQK